MNLSLYAFSQSACWQKKLRRVTAIHGSALHEIPSQLTGEEYTTRVPVRDDGDAYDQLLLGTSDARVVVLSSVLKVSWVALGAHDDGSMPLAIAVCDASSFVVLSLRLTTVVLILMVWHRFYMSEAPRLECSW